MEFTKKCLTRPHFKMTSKYSTLGYSSSMKKVGRAALQPSNKGQSRPNFGWEFRTMYLTCPYCKMTYLTNKVIRDKVDLAT